MTALAPTLEAFFSDRLIKQMAAGPNTIAAYRDTWAVPRCWTAGPVWLVAARGPRGRRVLGPQALDGAIDEFVGYHFRS